MTMTPNCPQGRHKSKRILLLLLLIILLLLLTAYATLPHLPAGELPLPLTPVTETPAEPTATPAEPTATPEEPTATPEEPTATPEEPTATATEEPTATPEEPTATATEEPTATPEEPTATATEEEAEAEAPGLPSTPTESPGTTGEADGGGGDMEALDEVAGPIAIAPAPTETLAVATTIPTSAPVVALPVTPTPEPASVSDVVLNNDFSQGFQSDGVGVGWSSFNNGGAEFSYFADTIWPAVLGETGPSQTLRIRNADVPDRYLGIYQTVDVVPGQAYTLSMSGLVRTNSGDVDYSGYGYRLQIGFDMQGGANWEAVKGWIEMPWDEQLRAQDTYGISSYATTVIARSNRLTVFVRAWKKWADAGEGAYDITNVSLFGPTTFGAQMPGTPAMPVTGRGEASVGDTLRLLITLILVVVLVTGAMWRARRQRQV